MSSLKMTFSLTSLIVLIAFGLVFFNVPVIADNGATAIPAGGETANHGTDGHADQDTANEAENENSGHMHPVIMISATDADPTMAGTQVVPTAVAANDSTEHLSIAFPIEITIPKNTFSGNAASEGTDAPSETTLSATSVTGESFIGQVTGGDVEVGTFALKANTTYTITAVATVTISGPATGTDNKAHRAAVLAAKTPLEVKIMVAENVVYSSETRGDLKGQNSLPAEMTFTLIGKKVDSPADPVAGMITGTPSLTSSFTVTFTFPEDKPVDLVTDDITVDGGYIIGGSLAATSVTAPRKAKTMWQADIQPRPNIDSITVKFADGSKKVAGADTDGMLTLAEPKATLNSITAADGANDKAAFLVTLTFAAALPEGTSVEGTDLKVTPSTAQVGRPYFLPATPTMWHVQIVPTASMDTMIELSDAGKVKFAYSGSAATVKKSTAAPALGTLAAAHDAATMTTTISEGRIAGNGFAVIDYSALPDLELFFDIGGSIDLNNGDSTDDKNSRTVVISEILWGLDLGETVLAMQRKHQFIELYNTTDEAIDLMGWKLTFTAGNVRPAIDIDQVSNRGPGGWEVDTGETGKSGRVTGTIATDQTSLITPVNIISMYRNINYTHVKKEAVKDTVNRGELVKGIPGGNGKGSWKNSIRRSTSRWIYSTKGGKHHTTIGILAASSVPSSPFRINEIANDDGGENDWIELHNVTDSEQSLKNYSLSMVTNNSTDTRLFHFHDQDWKVPAKGYVVISTRHPIHTDLAAGKDISVADDQEENKGASHLYVVKSGWNLQDDGKFALILRNHHEKQKTAEHLIDVVATRQGAFGATNTSLWPLKLGGNPHENVIDHGDENFAEGKVYQRNGGDGRGEKQFAVRGFTGIGYDRAAEDAGSNGGTPGYDNGAVKEKIADLSGAEVSFSEIMLGLGEGRQNLPQWIEIYNSSMTLAVNTNGWKLHVENTADVKTALDAVLTLGNMEIPPNQTILIATNTGRVSDPDHFPSNRVLNLWTTKAHRDALQMIRRTDQVFSTTGLYLKLTDKDGKTVDEFGNLDGDRRTRDELDNTWMIPVNDDDDERRSSLIRVYEEGVAIKGTMAEAWVLADETGLAYAISETYYGDPDDFGTPGFRGGGPLPVSLSKFRPERLDTGEIVIRWITQSELNNAGFNILRSEERTGEFKQINTKLIAGQGTTSEKTTYEWKDTSAKPNVVYYYQIQDVSLDGKVQTLRQSRLKGHVSPAGKLTTTWGELKALQ